MKRARPLQRALFILTAIVYAVLFLNGISSDLGVYCNPTTFWIAAGCGLIGIAVGSKTQKWIAGIALVVAIFAALYGYRHNIELRTTLERLQAQPTPLSASQTETNK